MSSSKHERDRSKFTGEGVREYERRRYRGIDQRIVHAREVRLIRKLVASIRDSGEEAGPNRILDLPCGYGRFTELLRRGGADIIDCDLSIEMVSRARANSGEPGVVADATKGLPFKSDSFAFVFSIRFFHHLHDPSARAAVLREFLRVTSGWAIITFYRMNTLHLAQRRIRRLFGKSRTRIKMTEPGRFEQEAEAAGFEFVRVLPLFPRLHAYHIALLRKNTEKGNGSCS
jgi:SAM-dependent methyltransferase